MTETPSLEFGPRGFPPGSEIQEVAFVSKSGQGQPILFEFPGSMQRCAVPIDRQPGGPEAVPPGHLLILTIPAALPCEDSLQTTARAWVDATAAGNFSPSQIMTLQGAQVFWSDSRLAVLAPSDRLTALRATLIEASFYDAELRDIERTLGDAWPQLEADAPLAFEFQGRSIPERQRLQQRFRQVLTLRARLARLSPLIHCPHVHPPTLASQVGERFRERSRMLHRHEFLNEQLEVFEKIYEACGQRASDFMLARSGHALEWVIIVLLTTQLLLSLFEFLAGLGK